MQKIKKICAAWPGFGWVTVVRSKKLEIRNVKVMVHIVGLLMSLLLIAALAFFAINHKEALKEIDVEEFFLDDAVISEDGENAGISWKFNSTYRWAENVVFELHNATEYAGEEITIIFENENNAWETQYIVPGVEEQEVCGMGLRWPVGRNKNCQVSALGASNVISDIACFRITYKNYHTQLMALLLMGCLCLLFSFAFHLESTARWFQYLEKAFVFLRALAMPLLIIGAMEYLGGGLFTMKPREFTANIVIGLCLYLLLFMVTNRLRFSFIFTNILLFIVGVANYFVILFRNAPLVPYDLFSFQTALAVVGEYEIKISETLVFSAFLFAVSLLCAWKMPYRIERGKKRIGFAVGGCGFLVGMTVFFYGFLYPLWGLKYSVWMPIETYQKEGYLMSTMIFAKYATLRRPAGYSAARAKHILAPYRDTQTETASLQPANLIVIMNESWSSLEYVKHVETNLPYDTFYQSLSENTIKGNAYVSICGGNTAQTEYEFFTGNSVSALPTGATAYEFFVKKNTENICTQLKQQDYSCYAIHPFEAGSYHRDKAYEKFGFDAFITRESFDGYEQIRTYYSDASTYKKVIELYESKQPGEKLFVWDLTMQNHGGYNSVDGFENEIYLTEYPELEQAAAYVTLMKYTDEALRELIAYFEKEEEPTMIVMFGDHQPALSDGTYDVLYGEDENDVGDEEREKRYITPFLIWNNYGLEESYIEQMSSNYLSAYIFRQAGFALTPYQNFLLELYEYYPVVNVQGVYDAQGKFWSWDDVENSADYEKLHDYQIVQYYRMKK